MDGPGGGSLVREEVLWSGRRLSVQGRGFLVREGVFWSEKGFSGQGGSFLFREGVPWSGREFSGWDYGFLIKGVLWPVREFPGRGKVSRASEYEKWKLWQKSRFIK